jgi:GTP cyclohydrolase I
VKCRARRFQLQEYLVKDIATDLLNYADADAVQVVARARHLCVCYRGPNEPTVSQTTTYGLGNTDKLTIVRNSGRDSRGEHMH